MNHRQISSGRVRSNLGNGIWEGMLSTPFTILSVPGSFVLVALLTQYFKMDNAVFGWIVSMPSWSNAAQVVLLPILAGFLSAKDLALGMGWFNAGLWAMLVLTLPLLPQDQPAAIAVFFTGFFLLASPSQAFCGVGWTAWVRAWVPQRLRGGYIGNRNRWNSVVTVAYLLFIMVLFKLGKQALWPFLVVTGVAVILRLGSLIKQHAIKTRGEGDPVSKGNFLPSLKECWKTPGLVVFIIFSVWMNFWMGFTGPFAPVFCFKELGLQPSDFTMLVMLGTLTGIAGWSFWGKAADRIGCVPILIVGTILWEAQQLLWVILTPSTTWLLYPMYLWGGFFAVSFFMGSFNLLLNLAPERANLAAVSLHLAFTSAAAAVSPMLAGFLLDEWVVKRGGGLALYHLGFLVKSIAFFLGLLLLARIHEPGKSARSSLPGAFRSVRQMMASQGLEFLSNTIPFRKGGSGRSRDAE